MFTLAGPAGAGLAGVFAQTPSLARLLSVLAWGRNAEFACGVEQVPLVPRPTALLDLHGRADIVAVRAGKLNSAAVTAAGEALTWGDGKSAKLGHGNDELVPAPARVESLVGRAEVANLALGDQHTLFLDRAGGVWAVGCTLEGQCGLGTPIEELARQHRRALYGSMQLEALLRARPAAGGGVGRHEAFLRHHADTQWAAAGGGGGDRRQQQHPQPHGRQSLAAMFARPAARGAGAAAYVGGGGGGGGGGGAPQMGITSSGIWGVDIERHLSETGVQPGVVHTPTRVSEAPLFDAQWSLGGGAPSGGGGGAGAAAAPSSSSGGGGGGLERERVVGVDCSRYFSIAVTDKGEVWTFGASYTGALAQRDVSWSTSAARVEGPVADAIAAEGGAVAVAAGGAGAACLTASGKVVLFGGFCSPAPQAAGGSGGEPATAAERAAAADAARLGYAIASVPAPVKSIAAGAQHVALSDGERLWLVGRWLDGAGREAGAAPFYAPAEVLHLPAEGISKVVAGAHATGAVSGDGRLFLSGRLVDRAHGEALLHKYGGRSAGMPVDWAWPGFGGAAPAAVPGVSGVVDAALGGWHACVLCE
ncbi:MAG: regulator of chromosome condensation 1/beta-lactamase-inhibitor protein II [Monoraphidium minutum]|nr:MAG: regulator of chromosome condensation 1/beta-lactamase-inhibitor protein II [Monoraphidium minutum]